MNKRELAQRLVNEDIDKYSYCLEGGYPNESHCIFKNGDVWEVYYSEKGRKSKLKMFDTEEEACKYFYSWLIKTLQKKDA